MICYTTYPNLVTKSSQNPHKHKYVIDYKSLIINKRKVKPCRRICANGLQTAALFPFSEQCAAIGLVAGGGFCEDSATDPNKT